MNQLTDAMKSVKTIQQEMTQWENRKENLISENNTLQKQNKQLSEEIETKRADYQNYIYTRDKQLKDGWTKLHEDQMVLEQQRTEFKEVLAKFQKDKEGLAHERMLYEKEKSAFGGQKQAVDGFIQAVRRAYSLIAE